MEDLKKIKCRSCGNIHSGNYCNQCGEKKLDVKERTIVYFFGQIINALTFSDTKLLKTLGLLLSKPGFLAKEYIEGRRNLYTKPLSLFFIINLVYFIAQPVDTFQSGFYTQTHYQSYSPMAKEMAQNKMEKEGITLTELSAKYNKVVSDYSKTLIILLVFLFSIPLLLLFPGKSQYYFNHLIFSLNFISFIFFGLILLLSLLFYLTKLLVTGFGYGEIGVDINGGWVSTFLLISIFVYLIMALKRFYGQKYLLTIPKAALMTLSTVFVIIGYRFLMFLIIMITI